MFIKLGEKCNKCGDKENLTIDHIEEFRKNGNNQLDNLQLLCVSCHLKKNLNLQLKIKERQLAQLKEKLASPNFLEDAKKHFINLRREDG